MASDAMTDTTAAAYREAAYRITMSEDTKQLLLAAAEQREQADARDETQTLQLAAIMTASIQNTPGTRQERITRDHPYWSVAYSDVCVAIDREIALREQLAEARILARQAVNGWACHAKRKIEHDEIARVHTALDALEAI